MRMVTFILRCAVALAFFAAAIVKLSTPADFAQRLAEWGYPAWTSYLIVTIELAGGLALLFSRAADTAAGVLILLMLGALYTHFSHGDSFLTASPAIVLLLGLAAIVILRRREQSAISL